MKNTIALMIIVILVFGFFSISTNNVGGFAKLSVSSLGHRSFSASSPLSVNVQSSGMFRNSNIGASHIGISSFSGAINFNSGRLSSMLSGGIQLKSPMSSLSLGKSTFAVNFKTT